MAETEPSTTLLYAIHHIFLPPKLPQEDDGSTVNDHFLCEAIYESSVAYHKFLPNPQQMQWDPISTMLENLRESQAVEFPSANLIDQSIRQMCSGDVLALLIRAQNAAVIFRKFDDRAVFEAFEVSPPAGEVMKAAGKLVCSYPGPAIEVPISVFDNQHFRKELASFLAQMNRDVLDSAATTTKAGSIVLEERDVAHPRYITQLLTGILRGMGKATDVPRIRKRIGDDVLWKDTKNPWRRSPVWLVLRVALQTTLHDNIEQYKAFMMFAMADILRKAVDADLASDLLFSMRTKLSRRLYKLGDSTPDFVIQKVKAVGEHVEAVLQARWSKVQKSQSRSPAWVPPPAEQILADTRLSLLKSKPYFMQALRPESHQASYNFHPQHTPRLRGVAALENISFTDDPFVALSDFEFAVQEDLDAWVRDLPVDSACMKLAAHIESYSKAARNHYISNPEDLSMMLLTVFELWVALDKLAIGQHPLMRDYSPEIPLGPLEALLLRKFKPTERLTSIVQHLRSRHERAKSGWTIYTDEWSSNSFAIRYFEQSLEHQQLKLRIEADANVERSRKREELRQMNAKHVDLTEKARVSEHLYGPNRWGSSSHWWRTCEKCRLESEAANLTIEVHEWPLSQNRCEAMATVFELRLPTPFRIWREMTHFILYDICTPHEKRSNASANPSVLLGDYEGLDRYIQDREHRRITLASSTKSFPDSHYKSRGLPTVEDSVCVNNGLQFRLVDAVENIWASGGCFSNVDTLDLCSFQIPSSSPYKGLQYAINKTIHTSNEVIANQSDCHRDMNLHEYIAFASLRAGCRLQWLNIARELPARCLSFRREEVFYLLMQAAWQIGTLSFQHEWEWHTEITDAQFGRVLLDELKDLMDNIKANWLEAVSMRTIIFLVSRLLVSTRDQFVINQAYTILRTARTIAFDWMAQLAVKFEENDDERQIAEIQRSLCEVAATCRSTYDVDPNHLDRVLESVDDVAKAIKCAIVIRENTPPSLSEAPSELRIILERDRRLSHTLESPLGVKIQENREGLDRAIASHWSSYRAGSEWLHHASPNDRWITSETATDVGKNSQCVDFNLLDGQLLVDGKALSRLPQAIVQHATYRRIFGQKIFDIVPSDMEGVEYASRTPFFGYQVFFSLRPNEDRLVIRTRRKAEVLELIPHQQFSGDLPTILVDEYAHWLNISSKDIELRPLQPLHGRWKSSDANWWISSASAKYTMPIGQAFLVDVRSPTFKMISERLKPLEHATYLTVTHSPQGLSVELPRYRLSFFLNDEGQLESRNFPGLEVDENQSSGTMFGLVNQIVLRAKQSSLPFHSSSSGTKCDSVPLHSPSRCVIIPFGRIDFEHEGDHTSIVINTDSQRQVSYHKYQIDTVLGRLVGNVSLISKLYKVYLHAVSSHCLPDPLTGRTGTEEALNELCAASCQSFQTLEPSEIELLQQIALLTPCRAFYPANRKVMQIVGWSQLLPLAQHDGYRLLAESIMDYARRLQIIQGQTLLHQHTSETNAHLLQRAARRNSIHYPMELRDLFASDTGDLKYASRDLDLDGEASVCSLSTSIFSQSTPTQPSCRLIDEMKRWDNITSPGVTLQLSYSRDWLALDMSGHWLSLYDVCRQPQKPETRWQLAFSLCAFRYSSSCDAHLAPILHAIAISPRFRGSAPPPWTSYRLSDGVKPQQQTLSDLCRNSAITFPDSPSFHLQAFRGETSHALNDRRASHYRNQIDSQVSDAADRLMRQWPCENPALPSPDFSYLNTRDLLQTAGKHFQSWYHNNDLHEHLHQVQVILDDVFSSQSHKNMPSYVLRPCPDEKYSWHCPYVTLDSLLKGGAPKLKHTPVVLDWNQSHSYTALRSILAELQGSTVSPFHRLYGNELAASLEALVVQESESVLDRIPIPGDTLAHHQEQCANQLRKVLTSIHHALSSSTPIESTIFTAGLWPRLTLRSLLAKLTHSSFSHLSDSWQTALKSLAWSVLSLQRADRLIKFALSQSYEEFSKELKNNGFDALEDPDWLLIQVDNNFHARPIQIHCAKEMIAPSSQQNSVFQLNMGEGKSSVIVPLVASKLADGQTLARVVVLKALANQMFQLLVERLSGLTNRRIFYIPISRAIKIETHESQLIDDLFQECVRVGGVLVVQPEHILSFKLMCIDRLLVGDQTADKLLETQRWLQQHSRDILDESDEILHVRYQLIYTTGPQQFLEHHPDRWITIQHILTLARKHALDAVDHYPGGLEVGESLHGSFPRIRILSDTVIEYITSKIADDILHGALPNFPLALMPANIRQLALNFIRNVNITPQSADLVKSRFENDSSWKTLLLLRGLLGHGILGYTLKERRWRVDYGLDSPRTLLAVPYRAKDVPAPRAEFGHPDVAITLTCLSYYYQGLSQHQVELCFEHLLKQDNPTMLYENWIHTNPAVPQDLQELSSINFKDPNQFEERLIPYFHCNQAVIDFFLAQIVFPREAKEFPHKLVTSGWDLAERKANTTTGFSGTNDNQHLLPTPIIQYDPLGQQSTNAKVLTYLLQDENNHYQCSQTSSQPPPSVVDLLALIVRQTPEIQVLLDIGAQILEVSNQDLVTLWLQKKKNAPAAIFFDRNDNMKVMTRDHTIEPFISSPFNQQLEKCLVYLDDMHTRGTDLKLPRNFRAAVLLGPKITKDRLLQGAMRMRKLGRGQSVLFIAPQEVDQKIRQAAGKTILDVIENVDVVRWVMRETCADIQHRAPHWVRQGVDYLRRQEAWSQFCSSDKADTAILRSTWLQPESRPLEVLYGIRHQEGPTIDTLPDEIKSRCKTLDISSLMNMQMEEEQEREVDQEVEQERQIERPPKAKPATHQIHDRIRMFIKSGVGFGEFPFLPIHIPNAEQSPWSSDLLVTHDFITTVRDAPSGAGEYLRPVQWIISSMSSGRMTLVVLSPYEVDQMLPEIRRSKFVHLHQYTPKVTQKMKPLDHLTFHCIPPLPSQWIGVPAQLTQQLNLYAGQLYLPDHEAYQRLCVFLGVCHAKPQTDEDTEIQGDGFVLPEHRRGSLARLQVSQFQRSPLPALKDLIGYRRKGMGYSLTHIGKVLLANLLTEDDFKSD